MSFDYSTRNTFVTNVNVIAREYELQTGQSLSDDLRRQIEAAVNAATQNNHTESIRLLEQVAQAAPVPAIYNNLGVEYAEDAECRSVTPGVRAVEGEDRRGRGGGGEKSSAVGNRAEAADGIRAWRPYRIERGAGDDDRRDERTLRGAG